MSALTFLLILFVQGIVTPSNDGYSRHSHYEMPNMIGGSDASVNSALTFGRGSNQGSHYQGSHPDWPYGQRNYNTPPRSQGRYQPPTPLPPPSPLLGYFQGGGNTDVEQRIHQAQGLGGEPRQRHFFDGEPGGTGGGRDPQYSQGPLRNCNGSE